jgi:protein ImuB
VHWLAAFLPHLPLEVFLRGAPPSGPTGPFAVLTADRPPRVLAADRAAAAAGVRPGMELAAAAALAFGLAARERDEAAEAAALEGLAAWAMGFSPVVSPEPPAGLLLEVGGSLGLFGGLSGLCPKVRRGLVDLGHRSARVGAAPTPRAAWLLARAGDPRPVADMGDLPGRLAVLPLWALDLPPRALADLGRVGTATVGDLMALPRAGVAERFGPEVLLTLDWALGSIPEPRAAFVPPARFDARLPLPAETADLGALRFGLARLVRDLADFLAPMCAAVDALTLHLVPDGGPSRTVEVHLAAPERDRDLLVMVLMTRLERLVLARPVVELRLSAPGTVPLAARHRALFGTSGGEGRAEAFTPLLERLRARLGARAVGGLCTAPDHRPERAWRACPPGEAGPDLPPAPRPVWLLDPPQPLPVVRGRPWLGGPLALAAGPERIEGGWWDGHDVARDYYRAEDGAGGRHWVFRSRKGGGRGRGWFRHGLFA